jgi:hypothetical protein
MELSRKQIEKAGTVAGVGVGAAFLLACSACCLPPLAPLLAWLGVAGMALTGPVGVMAGVIGAGALVWMSVARRRRRAQCQGKIGANSTCQAGCAGNRESGRGAIEHSPGPIACTLSSTDFKERALWLSALKKRALMGHRVEGLSVHLSYRLEAAADVEKMVRQEQDCCAFLHFDLRRTATAMELTVTAPVEAAADAQALFAHLLPDRRSGSP